MTTMHKNFSSSLKANKTWFDFVIDDNNNQNNLKKPGLFGLFQGINYWKNRQFF